MNQGRGLFFYVRRSSPLHAARAGVGASWALAISSAALVLSHPLALLALLGGVLGGAAGACLWRELRRAGAVLRVSAQLTNAASGLLLWSRSYDREAKDVGHGGGFWRGVPRKSMGLARLSILGRRSRWGR